MISTIDEKTSTLEGDFWEIVYGTISLLVPYDYPMYTDDDRKESASRTLENMLPLLHALEMNATFHAVFVCTKYNSYREPIRTEKLFGPEILANIGLYNISIALENEIKKMNKKDENK